MQSGTALKILHIIPRFIGGGPERSLLAFVAQERVVGTANRHAVVILDVPVSLHMLVAARKLGVELVIRPERDALTRLIEETDIVQIHFWNHPAMATLLRTLAFPPARVVVWSHVLGIHAPQVLTEDVVLFGDRLVVTSRRTLGSAGARHARQHDIPIHYVPGVADMSRLDGFVPRQHDGICVGYIGVVNETKMHPRFAEMSAAIRAPEIRFVVCGGGGGEAHLRSRFSALGMADRVAIRGVIENIREALEKFDIFGYPLADDTYATSEKALQEAMWVGVPPVVFPHGGLRDLVENERTGLVVTTEQGYSDAIERLAHDTGLRCRLGEEARRFARAEFEPARWSRVSNELLRAMMDEPPRTREPCPGAGDSAAANFVRSLGDQAGPFATALTEPVEASRRRAAANEQIAAASRLLANGEGGVAHYCNAFPDDPDLRFWASLISEAAARRRAAHQETRSPSGPV
ncbi:glycosyl transferase group 1 [Rhodoplanes sp. Z2-YC6860]|nr:glycosyl transferase group 1 [Rhodoplanes sp. Z2-YC6860]